MKTHKSAAADRSKVPPQAQQIAGIVSRDGPLTQDALIKRMCTQVRTKSKKPMTHEKASRLLSYYKTTLIEGGFITLQFAACDGLRRKQSKSN